MATRAPVHVADLAAEPIYTEHRDPGAVAAVELGGVRTFLSVPMLKDDDLVGAFILCRQKVVRPFNDRQIALVTNFASQAVIAIENARLLNELRQRTYELDRSVSELQRERNNRLMNLEAMAASIGHEVRQPLGAIAAHGTRLGELFNRVVEHLERVHKGIGEMQTLAANVGDLKNVLTNVKVRGTYGEVQLALLLEQFLSPDQYVKNASVGSGGRERVEYAIKFPADGEQVLLPINSKFPCEDYEHLQEATAAGDAKLIAHFRRELETKTKACAKEISSKYINPPHTLEFAILFVPTESLYAEILCQPGLSEQLQRDYRVMIAGPTNLAAFADVVPNGISVSGAAKAVERGLAASGRDQDRIREIRHCGQYVVEAAHDSEQLGGEPGQAYPGDVAKAQKRLNTGRRHDCGGFSADDFVGGGDEGGVMAEEVALT